MGVMWTTEQQKVIDSRDCNILVDVYKRQIQYPDIFWYVFGHFPLLRIHFYQRLLEKRCILLKFHIIVEYPYLSPLMKRGSPKTAP